MLKKDLTLSHLGLCLLLHFLRRSRRDGKKNKHQLDNLVGLASMAEGRGGADLNDDGNNNNNNKFVPLSDEHHYHHHNRHDSGPQDVST
jgi:hypothetical protein